MSSRSVDDLRDLSDEDVRLLYDIVSAAEASRAPPFRALFAAYDKVLGQRGISKEHDQLYLRFLLRMGESRKEGQGLFEQFELLLEKLGFQVAFDDDDKDREVYVEDKTDTQDQYFDLSTSPPRIRLLQTTSFRPARRVSFDSAYDTTNDSKPLVTLPIRAQSSTAVPDSRSRPQSLSSQQQPSRTTSRGRLSTQPRASHPLSGTKRPKSATATDRETHESDETLAEESDADEENADGKLFEPAEELADGREIQPDGEIDSMKAVVSQQQAHKAYKYQLESQARTLRYHHVAAQAVRVFRNWFDSAQMQHDKHHEMLSTAVKRDADILRRQAFDQWRSSFRETRRQTETERFFHNLQHQASKARDLYLLTKAFTHWAQCTSDEVSRRTEARSRMLQTRYFKAWRDITAVNEIKTRRLTLSKFFSLWVRRTEQVYRQDEQAVQFNESVTLAQAYRKWFWQFCERRTPAWYTSRLQGKLFRKWRDTTREGQTRESWASDFRSLELMGKAFSQWTRRSDAVQEIQVRATNFRRQALLGMTAETLQREMHFAPLQCELSRAVDFRRVGSALATWKLKAQMATHATKVDSLRIMRSAWTKWNDMLRCQALTNVINDRVVLLALYKWVLAERLALCKRSTNERLITGCFKLWVDKLNSTSEALGQAKHALSEWRNQKSTWSILKIWSTRSQARQQEEKRAQTFRRHNLVSKVLNVWHSRLQHNARLDKWSNDARFYVLCSTSLQSWHSTTVRTKKNRRREAFTSFRMQVKVTNAKAIMQKWRTATKSVASMREQAEQIYQQQLLRIGTDIFVSWRQDLSVVQNRFDQANAAWDEHLLAHCMQVLMSRFQQIQESDIRAIELDAMRLENVAASSLRKLNWKAFQLKRHHESADSLNQRSQRRHYRDMLRFWAASAKHKQKDSLAKTQDSRHEEGRSGFTNRMPSEGQPSRAIASKRRTPFSAMHHPNERGQGFSAAPAWNPDASLPLPARPAFPSTPGYLRTPSRRTPASRLATQTQTQTPATSAITPFMSRIRAQYGSRPQPSDRYIVSMSSREEDGADSVFEDGQQAQAADLDQLGG